MSKKGSDAFWDEINTFKNGRIDGSLIYIARNYPSTDEDDSMNGSYASFPSHFDDISALGRNDDETGDLMAALIGSTAKQTRTVSNNRALETNKSVTKTYCNMLRSFSRHIKQERTWHGRKPVGHYIAKLSRASAAEAETRIGKNFLWSAEHRRGWTY